MPWFYRHPTGRPPHPDVLTPAEWRVLERVRAGRSNPQIAEDLGVSVNTVKTQLSSIFSKLELSDRSALAAWDGSPAERLGWLATLGTAWGTRIVVGSAVGAVGALFLFAMQLINQPGSPIDGATGTSIATTTAEPDEGPAPLVMPFSGVSADTRPVSIPTEQLSIGAPPPSPFQTRDGASREVVLYDTQTLTERALGEGGHARFSPGGTWLGWIAFTNPPSVMEGELHVLELATGDQRTIGTARSLRWLDDERVIAHVRGNEKAVINVLTGDYGEPGTLTLNSDPLLEQASGIQLTDVTPEVTGAPPWRRQYRVEYLDGSGAPLAFEAYRARLAPDGMIAFAVAPLDAQLDLPWGTPINGNIYLANPRTLEAEYVATGLLSYGSWPLDASEQYVFWTDDSCGRADGGSRFFDRTSGAIVAIDERFYGKFTPSGDLAIQAFGAEQLFDPRAMTYQVSIASAHVSWSPDYRYGAVGYVPGQGGRCG